METPYPPPQKKGIGALGWIGIGCGGIVLLVIIGFVAMTLLFRDNIKNFANDITKNPTKFTATTTAKVTGGEIVAADEANKRYTVRDKAGHLTTIYWDAKKQAPVAIPGDFSAIPKDSDAPGEPAPPVNSAQPQ